MVNKTEEPEKELVERLFSNVESEMPIQFDSMWDANAKEGNFISKFIASKYKEVDAVDINDYTEAYKKNLEHPNANFFVMDNRDYISQCKKTYDLILLEGPLCEIDGGTAEHFGMIDRLVPLIRPTGNTVLILNAVLEPYDYDSEANRSWKEIRNTFYGKKDTSKMSWQFMAPFYINLFHKMGLNVHYYDRVARRSIEKGDHYSIDLMLVVVERAS